LTDRTLEIDRVSKRYGELVALNSVTFEVRAGELFGLVGGEGAGKTTTMRIAVGMLAADAGKVRFDGEPITHETRLHIGYMPQERGLYPKMKVLDQLVYLAELHGLTANEAHRSAENWIARLGLTRRRKEVVHKLSLGIQQRVQLAAALVHDPSVLVLDEPFSGLDPIVVDVLAEVLREKASIGVPVVFSSHRLNLVERLCDRVGIIRSGQMVACGSVAELTAQAGSLLVVTAPSAPATWAANLPGVRAVSRHNTTTVLELDPGADDQIVLAAALSTGPVTEFRRRSRSLTDLFRDSVDERAIP
jgi:ABC-2 type transport system ATP-binding protein